MAIGIPEVIVIGVVIAVIVSARGSKIIPKEAINTLMSNFKSNLRDVKEVEYNIRDTIEEVEKEVKSKKANDTLKDNNKDIEDILEVETNTNNNNTISN